jgi:hypothetical protein
MQQRELLQTEECFWGMRPSAGNSLPVAFRDRTPSLREGETGGLGATVWGLSLGKSSLIVPVAGEARVCRVCLSGGR